MQPVYRRDAFIARSSLCLAKLIIIFLSLCLIRAHAGICARNIFIRGSLDRSMMLEGGIEDSSAQERRE